MQLGVAYPTREVPGDPDKIRKFIRAAEDLGFEFISHADHVLAATHADRNPPLDGPYTEIDSFDDPFVFFAFAAALTDKLEFVTGVLVLPQRQTALVAQQAADVDLFSKQRFRMGVGVGWNYVEYDALGQDFHTRGKRIEEQIGLLRRYWTEPLVSFEGRFDRVDRAGINPRPKRQIPIWYGANSEVSIQRAARMCDGNIFAGDLQRSVEGLDRLRQLLRERGRDEAGFGFEFYSMFAPDPASMADSLKTWRDLGGTHGSIQTVERGFGADIDAHIDFMAKVARGVNAG
jgi:probable F420-dependent oxidoreductase